MKYYCLQDEGELEPQKCFNLMVAMNDLITWIDPSATANYELTNNEIHHALTQSINST